MKHFLKTTIIGGVLFLVPVVIAVWILNQALQLAAKAAHPISKSLMLDRLGEWWGVGAATVIAVCGLIVVSFVAGVIATTSQGKYVSRWFDSSVLGGLPQYRLLKSMAGGLAQLETASGMRPALVGIEDGWQIGYLLELLENDWVAVFLPQAPTPMSGNVMYLPSGRVRPLEITMVDAMSIIKRMGIGSNRFLRGVDLTIPTVP